ncbi:MAG TPA: hypothetical protein PK307_04340 [Spirochaetota bacterium]|nr:hypothetical protein [Spirochaetota bacterium]HOD15361.1 hypothetical protein [Spirochaetota bacterium]HPG51389.1 hypothetical protein [Spirochaetota bacterium]HPN14358.1 hypothetical protein [Spirochaetota bacterium]HQL81405.1 hypothetical protein [Spirochaetota bacterium]
MAVDSFLIITASPEIKTDGMGAGEMAINFYVRGHMRLCKKIAADLRMFWYGCNMQAHFRLFTLPEQMPPIGIDLR